MVGLPLRLRRSWTRRSPRRLLSALYGRALYLPPSTIAARALPDGQTSQTDALRRGLQRFQRRLYLQRAAVTALRVLALALLVAAVALLLRLGGVALPVPLAPLVAAGSVLLAGLVSTLWERPSIGQVAHTLDRRLGLHEQIGSALELDGETGTGQLGLLLQQRARAALGTTDPAYILPWPSLRRERLALIALTVLAGISILLTPRAMPAHLGALRPGSGTGTTRQGGGPRRAGLPPVPSMTLLAPGSTRRAAPTSRKGAQQGAPGARSRQGGQGGRGANGMRFLAGAAPTTYGAHSGQGTTAPRNRQNGAGTGTAHNATGDGQGTRGAGSHSGRAGAAGTGRSNGRAAGPDTARGTGLHLTTGRNSAAGGVANPPQRTLQNDQSTTTSAQKGQQSQSGARTGARNGSTGHGARGGTGQRSGQNGHRGQAGASGQNGRGAGPGQGQGQGEIWNQAGGGTPGAASGHNTGASGQGTRVSRGGTDAYGDPTGRYGQRISDAGLARNGGSGRGGSTTGSGSTGSSAARLSTTVITLNGASGTGSGLTLNVGGATRLPGASGSALNGDSGSTVVSVPGYVAPDSNAVTPDDRTVVRGYFTPVSSD